ncbi:Armadillo-type fold, partial [Amanita muscaria]
IAKFLDELTMDHFDVVSFKILEWVNANDSETLYHVTRLIVEQAVKNPGQTDVCVHLCKKMVKKVSDKVRDMITKNSKCSVITGGPLFREHLGEVCQKELEGVTVSITATLARSSKTNTSSDSLQSLPEFRRRRLIRFVSEVSDLIITSPAIIEKWITTLLDAEDDEKLVTLSMLLDSVGPRWDASTKKLKALMKSCFVEMRNIAQKTDSARLRTPLQDVIERRNKGWVVNETTQQCRGIAEKRRASRSSEDEPTNEQPEVETVKTSKGGGKLEILCSISAVAASVFSNNSDQGADFVTFSDRWQK